MMNKCIIVKMVEIYIFWGNRGNMQNASLA